MKIIDLISNPEYKYKKVISSLICHNLNINKEDLFKKYENEIEKKVYEKIDQQYKDYQNNNKPLEYILGYVEFLGVKFYVNENTLIPRPETEYMIQSINEYIQSNNKKFNIIDIGTGSGVLGISTIYHNIQNIQQAIFTDISEKALEVAQINKNILIKNENVKICKSNLLEKFIENIENYKNNENIIIGNLPYIPDNTFDNDVEDNVKLWEPRIAFVGGNDGLNLYREMFEQIIKLDLDKFEFTMFLEMMTNQIEILKNEYGKYFDFEVMKTFHFNIKILKLKLL
ncbi:HemK/PrmC family methyltransferase [Candidatus Vampirococcus lugosii]|uniref:SAM-dependent methyltransferase n=1 Tax=Candidatus Vampirococcus lugosii TaxID=2789015 RepID=A0ABS5QL78_9BACT|nr:HemK/PrmC family methyltransferase [Candidatus Vampirococcus lugosii]MBS8121927.1 SAM-dependent methyltransferase [Candidatus Vampirococcus lugosii]